MWTLPIRLTHSDWCINTVPTRRLRTAYLTAVVWIYDQWCNTYCTCVGIFGADIPITLFVESYGYSVGVAGYNFSDPDPHNDTVTVVTSTPPNVSWATLTVQATSDEQSPVTLYQSPVGSGIHNIAFHPVG